VSQLFGYLVSPLVGGYRAYQRCGHACCLAPPGHRGSIVYQHMRRLGAVHAVATAAGRVPTQPVQCPCSWQQHPTSDVLVVLGAERGCTSAGLVSSGHEVKMSMDWDRVGV